jgi:hypothetical protein
MKNLRMIGALVGASALALIAAPVSAQPGEHGGRGWGRGNGAPVGEMQRGGGPRADNPGRNFDRGGRGFGGDRPQWQGRGGGVPVQAQQVQPPAPIAPPVQREWRQNDRGNPSVRDIQSEMRRRAEAKNDRRTWDRRDGRIDTRPVPPSGNWGDADRRWDGNRDGNWRDRNGDQNRRWDGDRNRNWGNRNWDRDRSRDGRWNDGRRWDRDRQAAWDRRWRDDRRYDWRSYRNYNRGIYRMPRYYAPSGWNYGYRNFSIGVTLFSGLYGSNYWIDDPYSYRLPPAYGSMRWIRYYDDALLVDVRNGMVVDVIRNFFW